MKLSLSWIFDHLPGSFKDHDISALIKELNQKVCEIESCDYISLALNEFTFGVVRKIDENTVEVHSDELKQNFSLPARECASGEVYLLKKDKKGWRWAEGHDMHSIKEGHLPALSVKDSELQGTWKDSFETEDYILSIDNVSLTHRPDLWGHRGFAREVAAILELPLITLEDKLASLPIKNYDHQSSATPESEFSLKIEDEKGCRRLAGMLIPEIEHEGSWLWMAQRLLKVDTRAINAIVDTTNYVMLDLSQPLHAFDPEKISKKQLSARRAKKGEKLTLLDEQELTLSSENLVISDAQKPLALAGIMGGAGSGVSFSTSSLLVESASFNSSIIRQSSTEFKVRTEASARFEKGLDPNQNIDGLLRFLLLLEQNAAKFVKPTVIESLGHEVQPLTLELTHEYIEKKLGVSLTSNFIVESLDRLGFIVEQEGQTYKILVPTFRSKDVVIKEDVVEEIVRSYGLNKIPHRLPAITMRSSNILPLFYLDKLRNYLAFSAGMHEVQNYAFFNEQFLKELGWEPQETIGLKNPISENYTRLVTSLIPNILKNIQSNHAYEQEMAFFECNDIWKMDGKKLQEKKSLAGIFYQAKKQINFYTLKELLTNLFADLSLEVSWQKADKRGLDAWYHPYKTAVVMHDKKIIGYAGIAHPGFLHVVGGNAFIFELDADYLMNAQRPIVTYKPLAKYQSTWLDVSLLIPKDLTAERIKELIMKSHAAIYQVDLVDFFEKDEWENQRSLTMRYFARAEDKTLTGEEIEAINTLVNANLIKHGAEIR